MTLHQLVEVLGIIENTNFESVDEFVRYIGNVEFSDPELVRVALVDGEWILESLAPFDTEETLTITMKNGDMVTVRVTDDSEADLVSVMGNDVNNSSKFEISTTSSLNNVSRNGTINFHLKYDISDANQLTQLRGTSANYNGRETYCWYVDTNAEDIGRLTTASGADTSGKLKDSSGNFTVGEFCFVGDRIYFYMYKTADNPGEKVELDAGSGNLTVNMDFTLQVESEKVKDAGYTDLNFPGTYDPRITYEPYGYQNSTKKVTGLSGNQMTVTDADFNDNNELIIPWEINMPAQSVDMTTLTFSDIMNNGLELDKETVKITYTLPDGTSQEKTVSSSAISGSDSSFSFDAIAAMELNSVPAGTTIKITYDSKLPKSQVKGTLGADNNAQDWKGNRANWTINGNNNQIPDANVQVNYEDTSVQNGSKSGTMLNAGGNGYTEVSKDEYGMYRIKYTLAIKEPMDVASLSVADMPDSRVQIDYNTFKMQISDSGTPFSISASQNQNDSGFSVDIANSFPAEQKVDSKIPAKTQIYVTYEATIDPAIITGDLQILNTANYTVEGTTLPNVTAEVWVKEEKEQGGKEMTRGSTQVSEGDKDTEGYFEIPYEASVSLKHEYNTSLEYIDTLSNNHSLKDGSVTITVGGTAYTVNSGSISKNGQTFTIDIDSVLTANNVSLPLPVGTEIKVNYTTRAKADDVVDVPGQAVTNTSKWKFDNKERPGKDTTTEFTGPLDDHIGKHYTSEINDNNEVIYTFDVIVGDGSYPLDGHTVTDTALMTLLWAEGFDVACNYAGTETNASAEAVKNLITKTWTDPQYSYEIGNGSTHEVFNLTFPKEGEDGYEGPYYGPYVITYKMKAASTLIDQAGKKNGYTVSNTATHQKNTKTVNFTDRLPSNDVSLEKKFSEWDLDNKRTYWTVELTPPAHGPNYLFNLYEDTNNVKWGTSEGNYNQSMTILWGEATAVYKDDPTTPFTNFTLGNQWGSNNCLTFAEGALTEPIIVTIPVELQNLNGSGFDIYVTNTASIYKIDQYNNPEKVEDSTDTAEKKNYYPQPSVNKYVLEHNDATGETTWQIIVNNEKKAYPEGTYVTITDTVPSGMTWSENHRYNKQNRLWVTVEPSAGSQYQPSDGLEPTTNNVDVTNGGGTFTLDMATVNGGIDLNGTKIIIEYITKLVDGEYDNLINVGRKAYTNKVNVTDDSGLVDNDDEATQEYGYNAIDKKEQEGTGLSGGKETLSADVIDYEIVVNREGKTLNAGNPLTLTDVMPTNVELSVTSIQVYNASGANVTGTDGIEVSYRDDSRTMSVKVPDGAMYTVKFSVNATGTDTSAQQFSNTASLRGKGYWEDTYDCEHIVLHHEGSAVGNVAKLTLYKIDGNNVVKPLQGAKFQFFKCILDENGVITGSEPVTDANANEYAITGSNGMADWTMPDPNGNIAQTVFYFIETEPSDPSYAIGDYAKPHYFIMYDGERGSESYQAADVIDKKVEQANGVTVNKISKGYSWKITNINHMDFTATKKWEGDEDDTSTRPAYVWLRLLRDGETCPATAGLVNPVKVTPNVKGDWTTTWENLPLVDPVTRKEYVYTVVEDLEKKTDNDYTADVLEKLADYTSTVSGNTITNRKIQEGNLLILKQWDDNDNAGYTRPGSITVSLYRYTDNPVDRELFKTYTLTASDGWYKEISNLDLEDVDGHKYTYVFEEDVTEGYVAKPASTIVVDDTWMIEVINALKTGLTVNKAWVNVPEEDRQEITVTLYRRAEGSSEYPTVATDAGSEATVIGQANTNYSSSIVLNSGNNWSGGWKDIEEEDSATGAKWEYYVGESYVKDSTMVHAGEAGFEYAYSYSGETLTIDGGIVLAKDGGEVITITNAKPRSISVTKEWAMEDTTVTWPENAVVTVQLYADGEPIEGKTHELTSADRTYTFTDLPAMNNGTPIVYTVDEISATNVDLTKFNKTITGDAENGFTITNTEKGEPELNINVEKVWSGTGAQPASITVVLQKKVGNGDWTDTEQTVTLTASDSWAAKSFTNLPAQEEGQDVLYRVKETSVGGWTTAYSDNNADGIGYDENNATVTITITNTRNNTPPDPTKTSLLVQKQWVVNGAPVAAPSDDDAVQVKLVRYKATVTNAGGTVLHFYRQADDGTVDSWLEDITVSQGEKTKIALSAQNVSFNAQFYIHNNASKVNGQWNWNNGQISQLNFNNNNLTVEIDTSEYSELWVVITDGWVGDNNYSKAYQVITAITEDDQGSSVGDTITPNESFDIDDSYTYSGLNTVDGITTLSSSNSWQYEFTDLPKSGSGYEYKYAVIETGKGTGSVTTEYSVDGGSTWISEENWKDGENEYPLESHASSDAQTVIVKNTKDGPSTGSLTITKAFASGSELAGANEDFSFDVTLTNSDDTPYTSAVTVTDKEHTTATEVNPDESGKLTVTVTGEGTATIAGLPEGTKYKVSEQVKQYWTGTVAYGDETKSIAAGDSDTVTVTNTKAAVFTKNWNGEHEGLSIDFVLDRYTDGSEKPDAGFAPTFTLDGTTTDLSDTTTGITGTATYSTDKWEVAWTNLPSNADGHTYTYKARETKVYASSAPDTDLLGTTFMAEHGADGMTITNSLVVRVEAGKQFVNQVAADQPTAVQLTLYKQDGTNLVPVETDATGAALNNPAVIAKGTPTETTSGEDTIFTWAEKANWQNLPKVENGSEVTYVVKETGVFFGTIPTDDPDTTDVDESVITAWALPTAYTVTDGTVTFNEGVGSATITNTPITVDVPIDKSWGKAIDEDSDYSWSITLRFEESKVHVSGPVYDGANTTDDETNGWAVVPGYEVVTISNDSTEAQKTISNLPMYHVYPNGGVYRHIYSATETAYELKYKDETVSKWDANNGLTVGTDPYVPNFWHDAGDGSDTSNIRENDDDFYHLKVSNSVAGHLDVLDKITNLSLTKTWEEGAFSAAGVPEEEAYAKFELRRYIAKEYREYVTPDPATTYTVTLYDKNNNIKQDEIAVIKGSRIRLIATASTNYSGEVPFQINDSNKSDLKIQFNSQGSTGDVTFTVDQDLIIKPYQDQYYNVWTQDPVADMRLSTTSGASDDPAPDTVWNNEAPVYKLQKGHWTETIPELPLREISEIDETTGQQTVYIYSYYFVEVDSNPKGYYVTQTDGSGNPIGYADSRINTSNVTVNAHNKPTPPFEVKKFWRGVPDGTESYPEVKFSLYQADINGQNPQDGHIFVDKNGVEYKDIPLNHENDWTWKCPIALPATLDNGVQAKYYVVETVTSGELDKTRWRLYGYSTLELKDDGTYKVYDDQNGAHKVCLLDSDNDGEVTGTLVIHNTMGDDYIQMDVKKKFIDYSDNVWQTLTADVVKNTVLGFKVIRKTYNQETGAVLHDWEDYGKEMLVGYGESPETTTTTDANGNLITVDTGNHIESNEGNGFDLTYAGLWHWTIMDEAKRVENEKIGLPKYGFYKQNDGTVVPTLYAYSIRETGVYANLDRDPWVDSAGNQWDWWSTITPPHAKSGDEGIVENEEFYKQEDYPVADSDRVNNYKASDLKLDKVWLGDADNAVKEIYVKVYRYDGNNEETVRDFTQVIAGDVKNNNNWQGYLKDPTKIDKENEWLILDNENGWAADIVIQNAIIASLGEQGSSYVYYYYAEEVGYKDANGVVHVKEGIPYNGTAGVADLGKFDPRYDKQSGGEWQNTPHVNQRWAQMAIGSVGQNAIRIINAPTTGFTAQKEWYGTDGTTKLDENEVKDKTVTFKVKQYYTSATKTEGDKTVADWNSSTVNERIISFVTNKNDETGSQTLTIGKAASAYRAEIISGKHDKYLLTSVSPAADAANWTIQLDGLQAMYTDDDGMIYYCKYELVETQSPGFKVEYTGNDIAYNGSNTVTIKNTKTDKGTITVTKVVQRNGVDDKTNTDTFYVGLFTRSGTDGEYTYSRVDKTTNQEVKVNSPVTFENLEYGTYYVFEMEGNEESNKDKRVEDSFGVYTVTGSGTEVTVSADNPAGSAAIVNKIDKNLEFTKVWRDAVGVTKQNWPLGKTIMVHILQGKSDNDPEPVTFATYTISDTDLKVNNEISAVGESAGSLPKLIVTAASDATYSFKVSGLPASGTVSGGTTSDGTESDGTASSGTASDSNIETYYYFVKEDTVPGYLEPKYYMGVEHKQGADWIATGGTIANDLISYELPSTGGIGTTLFTALGGLMTATAGAILTIRRKKQYS